ncbi:hypothetical protein C2857_006064 [Epichloe festucae Fl1]|uniref:Cytochrome b5 heme-binding domain-containing protein n=1 Tax=Epichloe festucae (strain Fl1) TaxID=877507 RepID=A0A7S9PSU5_EPIFF|nr:hypothetical protein C2857_006064 [Epichloe festucae Fl1]
MSSTLELTYQDVAEHNTKKDIYVVIHDKIYDCAQFIDEHPGGEEVLLDCAGQDATEAFEDVGHSDEARETLDKLQVGVLKRQPGDPTPKASAHVASGSSSSNSDSTGLGIGVYFILLVGGALGYFAFQYMAKEEQAKTGAA